MATVRTRFQPRHEIEVPDQEAEVLKAQGLLYEGSDEDLAALLASDPTGPLDPRPEPPATAEKAAKTATAPAAEAKPAETVKGA